MKAVQVTGTTVKHDIILNTSMPQPAPKPDEVLIKVHAAGVTADEVTWPELYETPSRIPGHDISGVVHALGPEYAGPLSVGDSVFAMLNANRGQGQAEYAVASADEIAPKPKSLSHGEAAALPIPILTAWEAMHRHAKMEKGMRVLVTGASGAVGTIFVQLASHLLGAKVVALASTQNHSALKELGAGQTVDYKTPGWEQTVEPVDVVFDTAGGDVLSKTWKTVKSDGIIITVADPPPPWAFGRGKPEELKAHPNVRWLHFILSPDQEALASSAELIDAGSIKPLAVKIFPTSQAADAWAFASQRGRKAKSVIDFTT